MNAPADQTGVITTKTRGGWEDDLDHDSEDQLFFVTSYSDFNKLAHGPRGTPSKHPLSVYRFHARDGSLVLLNILGGGTTNLETKNKGVINPAFSRHHPKLNVVYTCTEDIEENGFVYAYSVAPDGALTPLGGHCHVNAGGTSTCYLTLDKALKHLLCVNYWDSTVTAIPLCTETGAMIGPVQHVYDPKHGAKVVAAGRCKGGVNHSCNDASTIRMRQADPHSHALVLDPYYGTVAYVPDLGKDLVRELYYNRSKGQIQMELNVLPSSNSVGKAHGPRYFEFHPKYNVAYVVNELSSTVSIFEVDRSLLQEMASTSDEDISRFKGRSTLRLIQTVKTIPSAFPTEMNTCGRICVHKSGRFVVVSNRGHQSIAVFRVRSSSTTNASVHSAGTVRRGELCSHSVQYYHTRGETPRHFQFDASGQYLLVANQDTDSIAVFTFNLSSGEIQYTGNEYRVPSPNFVCCCPVYPQVDSQLGCPAQSKVVTTSLKTPTVNERVHLVKVGSIKSLHRIATTDSSGTAGGVSELSGSEASDTDGEGFAPKEPDTNEGNLKELEGATIDNLQEELLRARLEIARLRKQLSTQSNE